MASPLVGVYPYDESRAAAVTAPTAWAPPPAAPPVATPAGVRPRIRSAARSASAIIGRVRVPARARSASPMRPRRAGPRCRSRAARRSTTPRGRRPSRRCRPGGRASATRARTWARRSVLVRVRRRADQHPAGERASGRLRADLERRCAAPATHHATSSGSLQVVVHDQRLGGGVGRAECDEAAARAAEHARAEGEAVRRRGRRAPLDESTRREVELDVGRARPSGCA